jgi:DNA modification methylase
MQLLHGDCLELMKGIPDESVDMILCDLPYGTTSRNEWDKKIPLAPLWEQYERIIKGNGAIVLFSQMPFGAELIQSNRRLFRYEWIWKKHKPLGFLNAHKMPLRLHENILVFYKALPTYNPQKWMSKPYYNKNRDNRDTPIYGGFKTVDTKSETGERLPVDVIQFVNSNNYKQYHAAQKPIPLLEYLIKTYTNEGDIVLDNCMGSGSTGVACIQTGRDFIGIELDDNYFEIAQKRIYEAQEALDGKA